MKSNKKVYKQASTHNGNHNNPRLRIPLPTVRAFDGAEMGNRPRGLHVKSNSFYPLRPESAVSKARTVPAGAPGSAETGDGAAGRGRGAQRRSPAPAPPRCGCTARARGAARRGRGGWRCFPSHGSNYSGPSLGQGRPGTPPLPPPPAGASRLRRPRPQPRLLQLHNLGCRRGTRTQRQCVRRGDLGSRTRGAGNGQQRQPGARTQPAARTHLQAPRGALTEAALRTGMRPLGPAS